MCSKSPDLFQDSLQNKQGYKLCSRIVSELETTMSNPSFRFYNNSPGAVPFLWESRPGTPKCPPSETTLLPPLTPPPSYYCFNSDKKPINKTSSTSSSRSCKLLHVWFPKMMNLKKTNSSSTVTSSYFSSSSSSSSSWSLSNLLTVVPVSPKKYQHRLRGRRGSSFDSRVLDYHYEEEIGSSSPTSTWCFFGIGKGSK